MTPYDRWYHYDEEPEQERAPELCGDPFDCVCGLCVPPDERAEVEANERDGGCNELHA